jgi:hypothetical protein
MYNKWVIKNMYNVNTGAIKMGSEVIFDTLQYANKLKAAGVPEKQAEVHAEAMAELIDNRLATKQDLKELELRMTMKLGSIVVGSISILIVLMKLFKL